MKRTTIFLAFLFVAASPVVALAGQVQKPIERPDFSGTWVLDREASEITTDLALAGLGGAGAPANLYITQAANGALILSSRANGAQPRQYAIEGWSMVPAPGDAGGTMMVTSRWNGQRLETSGSAQVAGLAVTMREVMSLADRGRELRLEVTLTTRDGSLTTRLVYEKAAPRVP